MQSRESSHGSRQQRKAQAKVKAVAAEPVASLAKRSGLIGRDKETEAIRASITRGKGLHLHGPGGAGKSALLNHVYQQWGKIGVSSVPIYCSNSVTLRKILVCIAEALLARSGPLTGTDKYLEQIEIRSVPDIRTNSNRDLRNMIFPRLEHGDYCVILDHLDRITQGINAFLDALYRHASVLTASRQSWVIGDYTFAGNIAYCLYLVPKLKIENLKKRDALVLMQQLYSDRGMKLPDKGRVFNDVYQITQGNPEMIRRVLDKARRPEYSVDGRLNLNLIVIDCRIDEVNVTRH